MTRLASLIVVCALAGCGNKGPLVLPDPAAAAGPVPQSEAAVTVPPADPAPEPASVDKPASPEPVPGTSGTPAL